MPLYEFICSNCSYNFELALPIVERHDPEKKPCPVCGEEECINYVFGSPIINLRFRGSTVQSKAPEGFKDILREIKKNTGGKATGIEL